MSTFSKLCVSLCPKNTYFVFSPFPTSGSGCKRFYSLMVCLTQRAEDLEPLEVINIFNMLENLERENSNLASPTGFEPVLPP